jgi:hypothetical protein
MNPQTFYTGAVVFVLLSLAASLTINVVFYIRIRLLTERDEWKKTANEKT